MEDFDYEARKATLIEEITAVFDGVSREDGVTFYEGTALDDGGLPERRAAARAKDTEKRWQDIPSKTFLENYSAISFLDPKGFRYYIPALAIWHLRFRETSGPEFNSNLFDSIIYHLQMGSSSLREYKLNRFQALTFAESHVIARFLEFEAEAERRDDEKGLASHKEWLKEQGHAESEIDATEDTWFWTGDAQKALDSYWSQFL